MTPKDRAQGIVHDRGANPSLTYKQLADLNGRKPAEVLRALKKRVG